MNRLRVLREHVDRLLGEPVSLSVDRSPDGVWACVTPRPAGTVTMHRVAATDGGWSLPRIVPGTEVWAPAGTALAAYEERDGVLFPCVVRPGERSVSSFDVPAGPLPATWLDGHRLVVPVPVTEPDAPPVGEPAVFEAGPFSRVRVLPADWSRPPRYALRILDTRGHGTGTVPLPVAPYRVLRACGCGDHLAAGTDDGVVLVDLRTGVTRSLGAPVGLGWVCRGAAEFLVTLVAAQGSTEIHARAPDGSGHRVVEVLSGAVLHHAFEPPGPWLLLGDPGTGVANRLVLVRPDAGGLSAPSWRIRGRPLCHASVALVDESAGSLRVAVVDTHRTRSRVRLLTESTPGTLRTGRRHADATGLGLLAVVDWAGGTVRLVGPGENRVVRLRDARPDDEPVVSHRVDDTRVWLYPPAGGREPLATAVSLLPRPAGPVRQRAHGLLAEHSHWLTRLGFAVAAIEVPLRWWPDVPDEQIREEAVSAIAAAVTGTSLVRQAEAGRLVVQGHSFAATLALQALADTDLFAAAMVSSGGYCRSLTPLGFQYEKRTLWEAPRVYQDFDAVLSAPRIRRPVLIVHGQQDRNPATPPEQAVLLFQCLTALGTPSRLVLLPEDGHHVRTHNGRATMLSEQAGWIHRWATNDGAEPSGI